MGSSDRPIQFRGSTVVRPAGYWTPAVHALLEHLHRQGFHAVPRPLGHHGTREVVSMIPGKTPGEDFVAPWTGDDQLISVAQLIRAYHDAASTFVPPAWAKWQETSVPTTGTVVCHTDLYRGNVVFRDGRAVGLIDFDFAHPAQPLWDLSVGAWHWVPLSDRWRSEVPPARWPDRLRIFVDAYGLPSVRRPQVVACIAAFLQNVRDRAVRAGRDARQANRDLQLLDQDRDRLLTELVR